jgi:HEAT repeat protein
MRSTSFKRVGLLAVAAILVGFIGYKVHNPNEPRHQGVRVTVWLRDFNVTSGLNFPGPSSEFNYASPRPEAEEAVREIGPSAAPYVIRKLRADDSGLKRNYRVIFPKFPLWLRKMLGDPGGLFTHNSACRAFLAIGAPAKPILMEALEDESPAVRSAAAEALWSIGQHKGADLRDAVPVLIESLRDSDAWVRFCSASALGNIGPDARDAVPSLIPLLNDPEMGRQPGTRIFVQPAAARALGKIGPDANAAIPALKILLGDTDAYKRREAAIAIWRINSDVTNTLPLLVEGIIQGDENTKWELIEAMAEMGSSAKDAVPALVQQLQQKPGENLRNEWNRSRISNALLKIDPEAAAKAGIK